MSRQCRSKVELIQLGSAHEKYGVWTRPKMSVSFANTFIAKSQKQMPLAEATQNRSFGNYSWTTRLKCDFNRKSFCKFGSGKIEKCEKMIIIFSFLLVGGRGTLCTLAPQLRGSSLWERGPRYDPGTVSHHQRILAFTETLGREEQRVFCPPPLPPPMHHLPGYSTMVL